MICSEAKEKSKIVYCISKDQQKAHIQYLRVDRCQYLSPRDHVEAESDAAH